METAAKPKGNLAETSIPGRGSRNRKRAKKDYQGTVNRKTEANY